MSANAESGEQLESDIMSIIQGGNRSRPKAERVFDGLVRQWGLPETRVGPDAAPGCNLTVVKRKMRDDEWVEDTFGSGNPMLAGAARQMGAEGQAETAVESVRDAGTIDTRATIDATSQGIKGASPVEVDPQIVQTLRSKAPILDRVTSQAQAGFTAQYNIINARSDPVGFSSESEVVDLSQETPQDFGLGTETKDMKLWVDLVEISDFTQRAESTLGYMDVEQTTLGQRMIEHGLQKARAFYYGDPSVASGARDIEDGDAYEGMVKLANDANTSYVIDKSTVSSGFLSDIRDELTSAVEDSGLTYDAAEIAVSPTMMDALADEANPVTRLSGFDDGVNFGRRSIQIKGVEVFEDPNIRSYSFLGSTTTGGGDNGDVFIFDTRNLQYRQLAPLSTVPLGRIGLADRAAMFEYGTLLSKSQGEHIRVLQAYDV